MLTEPVTSLNKKMFKKSGNIIDAEEKYETH